MARIELKHCVIRMKDGFAGSAAVNDTPAQDDVTLEIDTIAGIPNGDTIVPVGGRFTVIGDADTTFVVTAATRTSSKMSRLRAQRVVTSL